MVQHRSLALPSLWHSGYPKKNTIKNKRPLTPKSMPPTGEENPNPIVGWRLFIPVFIGHRIDGLYAICLFVTVILTVILTMIRVTEEPFKLTGWGRRSKFVPPPSLLAPRTLNTTTATSRGGRDRTPPSLCLIPHMRTSACVGHLPTHAHPDASSRCMCRCYNIVS